MLRQEISGASSVGQQRLLSSFSECRYIWGGLSIVFGVSTSSAAAAERSLRPVFRKNMRPTPETIPSGQEPVVSQGAVGAFANSLASPNALPFQRPNALVADDDPVARTLLVRLISSWGYDVVAVSDGDQAIQALEREDG